MPRAVSSGGEEGLCSEGHQPHVLVQMWLWSYPGDREEAGTPVTLLNLSE